MVLQALEGKNVKDLLSNVGSGGGAAAPAAGAPAAGGAAPAEEAKPEEKEEGMFLSRTGPKSCEDGNILVDSANAMQIYREGGVRRGYGFWSFRLDGARGNFSQFLHLCSQLKCMVTGLPTSGFRDGRWQASVCQGRLGKAAFHRK